MTAPPSTETPRHTAADRWYLASQNDGLFIINAPPRPSNDDAWHERQDGPSTVFNVTELPEEKAIKIVGVMNDINSHASLTARVAELTRMLKSASSQCGNVIYNCEQRPADNQRHLDSWKGVKQFIDAALDNADGGRGA